MAGLGSKFRFCRMSETLSLTRALIERPSVTPSDEGCQALIGGHLEAAGFALENMRFGEVDNLWARRGDRPPVVCFAGHTDVVPPGPLEQWSSNPFEPTLIDGLLYGRGAADMKSGLAAMVIACETFVAAHPAHEGSIALLITSDEEGRAADGTRRVMEALEGRGESIDFCIVGEPSSSRSVGDVIKIGRRGSLSGRLTVTGTQGHIAYAHLADNPIQAFAPALAELFATPRDQGNAHFPPTSFQVSNIASGTGAPNVIPGDLKAHLNFRYSTEVTLDELKRSVIDTLEKHGLKFQIDWHLSGEPFLTPKSKLIEMASQAVKEITGLEPERSTSGGTSDGRYIAPSGTHVVELGVVNETIHQVNECVSVEDIDKLSRMYRRILELMLSSPR